MNDPFPRISAPGFSILGIKVAVQTDEITRDVDEAINRVLMAERDAQTAVEDCRKQAKEIREQARLNAKRVTERAGRRASSIQTIADRSVSRAISKIRGEMSAWRTENGLSAEQLRQLDHLIDTLIDELV